MLHISLRSIFGNCPSTATSYCVVLRRYSIFPTLHTLGAKDRRKSPWISKMFALKLVYLTKIIFKTIRSVGLWPFSLRFSIFLYFFSILQNLAAAAGIGVRPSFAATGMAGIPHAATGLSLQAAIANQAAYGQALPAT